MLKNSLSDTVNLTDLPPFPKKKLVGGMETQFLENRKTELGRFFNALLSKNAVARNSMVLPYFASKQADQDSE